MACVFRFLDLFTSFSPSFSAPTQAFFTSSHHIAMKSNSKKQIRALVTFCRHAHHFLQWSSIFAKSRCKFVFVFKFITFWIMEHVSKKWREKEEKCYTCCWCGCGYWCSNCIKCRNTIVEHGPHVNNCINAIMLVLSYSYAESLCCNADTGNSKWCEIYKSSLSLCRTKKNERKTERKKERRKNHGLLPAGRCVLFQSDHQWMLYSVHVHSTFFVFCITYISTFKWKVITKNKEVEEEK